MTLLAAFGVILVGFASVAACVVGGTISLFAAARRSTAGRSWRALSGVVMLVAAGLLALVPRAVKPFAEARTGWRDADHNGVLDPFAMGRYDWMDVNAGWWAAATAVLGTLIGVALVVTLRRFSGVS